MAWAALALAAMGRTTAMAQGVHDLDPADPALPVPPPQYQSAFSDYPRYTEQPVDSWGELLSRLLPTPAAAVSRDTEPAPGGAAGAPGDRPDSSTTADPHGAHVAPAR